MLGGVGHSSLPKNDSNMENNDRPKIVVAQQFIKEKTIITLDGQSITNTPEDPNAVERYLASKRR